MPQPRPPEHRPSNLGLGAPRKLGLGRLLLGFGLGRGLSRGLSRGLTAGLPRAHAEPRARPLGGGLGRLAQELPRAGTVPPPPLEALATPGNNGGKVKHMFTKT